jgi:putative serine protease PepD
MRSQVVVPVVCAVLGGGVTAAVLIAAGVTPTGSRSTVVQFAPLLASGPVGGTQAGDVYSRASGGVVGVTARAVPVSASAFDVDEPRGDGLLSGSGFVVDADGRILTAAHLVRAASDVRVEFDGRSFSARVLGVDESNDLAVLRVDGDTSALKRHALELGDSDTVRVGDPAIAIGHIAGLAPTLAAGTVAARQPRVVASGGAAIADALQVDAPLHAGDYGGPLLDVGGRVTGVNTRVLTADGERIDLAVPINTVRRVLPLLTGKTLKVIGG